MYGQASVLSNAQKSEVVAYLAREIDDSWLQLTLCTAGTTVLDLDGRVSLARFGVDYLSTLAHEQYGSRVKQRRFCKSGSGLGAGVSRC